MKRKLEVLSVGEFKAGEKLDRFEKDILRPGTWVHPVTKKMISFDEDRLSKLVDQTNKYLKNENKVPFPDGHSTAAKDNMGWWLETRLDPNGNLMAVLNTSDQEVASKLKNGTIDSVSACIEFGLTDSRGNFYPEVITHICGTNYPVIEKQGEFVALSRDAGVQDDVEIYVEPEQLGDNPGHEFHGNQWSDGSGGGKKPKDDPHDTVRHDMAANNASHDAIRKGTKAAHEKAVAALTKARDAHKRAAAAAQGYDAKAPHERLMHQHNTSIRYHEASARVLSMAISGDSEKKILLSLSEEFKKQADQMHFGMGVKNEALWSKAKAQAEKEGHGDDYAYITGIYKKMGGEFDHMMSTVSNSATGNPDGGVTMDLSKLALLLGLPKDTKPEEILAAAEKAQEEAKANAAIATQLATLGFKVEDGKVVKLDAAPKTDREKELEATLEESRLQNAKAQLSLARSKAEAIVKGGKLPAAMQSRLERVLAVAGRTEAVALSTNDPRKVTNVAIDVAKEVGELFDAVPSILKEKLSTLPSLSAADVEAAKKQTEQLATRSKDIASRNQPKEYAGK